MKIFWVMDWNDGTPERDGDFGDVECAAEWPEPPAEAPGKAAADTRTALRRLVERLPLGSLANEDWVLKISPHGVIVEDEDYDEEAEVRG